MTLKTLVIVILLAAGTTSCKSGKSSHKSHPKEKTVTVRKTCKGRCFEEYKRGDSCQCNRGCDHHRNCCSDFHSACPKEEPKSRIWRSCSENCDEVEEVGGCLCHPDCHKRNKCCLNYDRVCSIMRPVPITKTPNVSRNKTCSGKCGQAFKKQDECQCNFNCKQFNNCCSDFETLCSESKNKDKVQNSTTKSCQGKCNQAFVKGDECQCNANCNKFANCCPDFNSTCTVQPSKATTEKTQSCSGKCFQAFKFEWSCQCNRNCENHSNCCPDYASLCLPESSSEGQSGTLLLLNTKSCAGKCNSAFRRGDPCQCNRNCNNFNNCCPDFNSICVNNQPSRPGFETRKSCRGKCNELVHSRDVCQCNPTCEKFNSCCPDYVRECKSKIQVPIKKSCSRRCNTRFKPGDICQCNANCHQFGNCCPDYDDVCTSPIIHGDTVVTDDELKAVSEKLLTLDINNAGRSININTQGRKRGCSKEDSAPRRLFTSIHSSVWEIPTIKTLVALLDNYEPDVKINEREHEREVKEQERFLDLVLGTPVMNVTYFFLRQNGAFSGNKREFRSKIKELWFGMYDRDGDFRVKTIGSSGFEHVFVGELKNGEVGGFHHWAFFAKEEQKGNINYLGKRGEISFGQYGKGFTGSFLWKNQVKCTGSMTVGTSPEFDMALYTICILARPNIDCPLTLNGKKVNIRAFEYAYRGRMHVGTAFPNFKQN